MEGIIHCKYNCAVLVPVSDVNVCVMREQYLIPFASLIYQQCAYNSQTHPFHNMLITIDNIIIFNHKNFFLYTFYYHDLNEKLLQVFFNITHTKLCKNYNFVCRDSLTLAYHGYSCLSMEHKSYWSIQVSYNYISNSVKR